MTDPADTIADGTLAEADPWDEAPRRPVAVDAAPVLSIDGFEGPLDWLLELARRGTIDLTKLSVLALVEAFADALETALAAPATAGRASPASGHRLMVWGDWLVMAATLTLLRSRLMLPAHSGEAAAARDAAETLRRQLIDRDQAAATADWLERRPQLGRDVFGRGHAGRACLAAGRVGDVTALFRACLVALRLPDNAEAVYRLPPPPLWSAAQALARIRAMLPGLGAAGSGLAVFLPVVPADAPDRERHCRAAVAGTFVATLELAKEGALRLEPGAAGLTVYRAAV